MNKIMQIKGSKSVSKNQQKKLNGGSGPVYFCVPGGEGQACVARDGQIGQCNSLGVCEC